MRKKVLVAQSGGPTVAINASLAGVIAGVAQSGDYEVFGAANGIKGVLDENFINLSEFREDVKNGKESVSEIKISQPDGTFDTWSPKSMIDRLAITPSMYLGSCRYKLPSVEEGAEVYEKIFSILDKNDIGMFFYIGGNDSMDTVNKLSTYGRSIDSDIRFAGVPKSIDNDLPVTDHTPGYGSAAKYIAASMAEMAHDVKIYDIPCVTIVELMGRNAGWLTAAAALARNEFNEMPQLVYLPEVDFDKERFMEDVKKELKKSNCVMVAVSEGIHDREGNYISAGTSDVFGHNQLGGAAKALEILVKDKIGIKLCISGGIGALLLILTGVISEKDALKSIDLKTIFLFGGTLSLASALQETGAGEVIANKVIGALGANPSPYILTLVVFLLCCIMTNFMSNTATTALMVPICLSIAQGMGADPRAVLMACVIGGSCAYATPIGMPANTMVVGAGGYKFMDYVKAGFPLIIIATVVSMIILPIAFPFFP